MKILRLIFLLLMFFTISNAQQWQKQNIDTKASLRGLAVVSQNVIWASGTGGTVLRTVDGGKNWSVIKVPDAEKLDFRDIEAFDADTAYILSIGTDDASRIYKTIDGGKTWKLQFKNTNEKAFFDALAFWDKNNGIAMSDPVDGKFLLFKTTDGENWNPFVPPDNIVGGFNFNKFKFPDSQLMFARFPYAEEGEAAFAASGTCLITRGKNEVYFVSGGAAARVFKSTDRGQDWMINSGTSFDKGTAGSGIFSIAMRDSKNGVIVGGNYEKPNDITYNLAFTRDGGITWEIVGINKAISKGLNGYRSGVTYIDKKTILAVGASGSDFSADGGKTWKNLDKENYNAVAAKGKRAVWAVGANGLVSKFNLKK